VSAVGDLDGPTLAGLVSKVTSSMCGIDFGTAPPAAHLPQSWRMALLGIPGARPLEVILFSDERSCRALAAGMFGMKVDQIPEDMIEDSLRELLNMAAGQIKSVLAPDQLLGLPRIIGEKDLGPERREKLTRGVVLQSRGTEQLFIAVLSAAAP
jgi:hypothetical protein